MSVTVLARRSFRLWSVTLMSEPGKKREEAHSVHSSQ